MEEHGFPCRRLLAFCRSVPAVHNHAALMEEGESRGEREREGGQIKQGGVRRAARRTSWSAAPWADEQSRASRNTQKRAPCCATLKRARKCDGSLFIITRTCSGGGGKEHPDSAVKGQKGKPLLLLVQLMLQLGGLGTWGT